MPWRTEPRDPYAVWISEVMLQQTRVAAVVAYYERFLLRFPNVAALARADVDEVLGLWSGLGYYRRARALHQAARCIVEKFGGEIPRDVAALLSLPGVGAYTASAIASIAHGVPTAVVDGNVSRVVARLFAIRAPIGNRATRAAIDRHAAALLDPRAPGRWNEAMMDLGATVCTPRSPACASCPLRTSCEGVREGIQEELPAVAPRRAPPRVKCTTLVAWHGDFLLLGKRRSQGLFGGLWEPLTWTASADRARTSATSRGIKVGRWIDCGALEHVLTHRVLVVRVYAAIAQSAVDLTAEQLPEHYERAAWSSEREIAARGMSTLARKVIAQARSMQQQRAER